MNKKYYTLAQAVNKIQSGEWKMARCMETYAGLRMSEKNYVEFFNIDTNESGWYPCLFSKTDVECWSKYEIKLDGPKLYTKIQAVIKIQNGEWEAAVSDKGERLIYNHNKTILYKPTLMDTNKTETHYSKNIRYFVANEEPSWSRLVIEKSLITQ